MRKLLLNKTVAKATFLMLIILITTIGCQSNIETETNLLQPINDVQDIDGMITLGEKLEDPFTVENMKIAFQNLRESGTDAFKSSGNFNIQTSHLYIRFLPESEAELSILNLDPDLILYDYPLDVQIQRYGHFFHDPEIPDGGITYQYCVVEVDKVLPEVEYQVLKELYLPHKVKKDSQKQSPQLIAELIDESFRNTDNDIESSKGISSKVVTPKGRIRMYDDGTHSYVGLKGAFVRVTGWYDTTEGEIDVNGNFELSPGSVSRRGFQYSIKWAREKFSIRTKKMTRTHDQTYLMGPTSGDWNFDIPDDHLQQVYALIHFGAYHYFYENILSLKRPFNESQIPEQIKIAALDEDGGAMFRWWGIFGNIDRPILIYRYDENQTIQASCKRLYGTVIHEIAHASHWELRQDHWVNNTESKLKESWAIGVQWSLAKMRYTPYFTGFEFMTFTKIIENHGSIYTNLIVDLVDSENQGLFYADTPYDRVSGYTISEIEAVLANCSDIADLRDNLKSTYNNATEIYLDELFEQYINLAP